MDKAVCVVLSILNYWRRNLVRKINTHQNFPKMNKLIAAAIQFATAVCEICMWTMVKVSFYCSLHCFT